MDALIFIVEQLLSLVFLVFLLRFLFQLARADFRNPFCQAIVRLTNPLIMPLRRVLPPIGKIDTASVLALIFIAFVEVAITFALRGFGIPPAPILIRAVALEIATTALWTYFVAILLYSLLSIIAPGGYSPAQSLLATLCEPVLRPFRRLIPPIAQLDLSPLWACIAIQALLILLH